jgi:Zn-dependent oligopeptidase
MLPSGIDYSFSAQEIEDKTSKILADYDEYYDIFMKTTFPSKEEFFAFYEKTNDWDLTLECMDFMQYVHPDSEVRNASVEASKKVSAFSNKWSMDIGLYQATKKNYEQFSDVFDSVEKHYMETIMKNYKHNGIHLEESKRKELQKLSDTLSDLSINYSNNLNEVKDFLAFSEDELDGVDKDFLETLEKTEDGKYKITTKYDHINNVMPYCNVEDTRKQTSIQFLNRGKEPFHNEKMLQESLGLRQQKAKLLDHENYSEYVLSNKRMAKSSKQVLEFLHSLLEKMKISSKKDVETLCNHFGRTQLESWNSAYYNNLYKKELLQYDEKEIQGYFPLEKLLPSLLATFEEIFHLQISEVSLEKHQTWHESVKCYAVKDNENGVLGDLIGHFYVDLYPREGKYGHAAAFTLKQAYTENEMRSTPVSAMVCNFSRATADKPALLTFREVETFFHELGHIFHQLLSKNRFAMFSGTAVECDFVECPSQALENWCYEEDFLTRISCHYETGEPLPKDLMDKIKSNKHLFQGLHYIRQLQFALYDMTLHISLEELDVVEEYNKIQAELSPMVHCEGCMAANFGHLMGGYQSGYYGYLWSEVYAAEVFQLFKESGNIFNRDVGLHYRKCILEKGGTQTGFTMLENLLGRPPNSDAFLSQFT